MVTQHQCDYMSIITHAGKLTVKRGCWALYPDQNNVAILAEVFTHTHIKLCVPGVHCLCLCTCVFVPTRLYLKVVNTYISPGPDHVFYNTTAIQSPGTLYSTFFFELGNNGHYSGHGYQI